jgi:hypothetical protein
LGGIRRINYSKTLSAWLNSVDEQLSHATSAEWFVPEGLTRSAVICGTVLGAVDIDDSSAYRKVADNNCTGQGMIGDFHNDGQADRNANREGRLKIAIHCSRFSRTNTLFIANILIGRNRDI